MPEFPFSIPISGVVRIGEDNTVTITVNRAETTVTFAPPPEKGRAALPKGMTVFDVLLETARHFVRSTGQRTFSAAELYREAVERYPGLRRNTWTSHAIASAPNHPSYKHHSSRKDYFRYLGNGAYSLNPQYLNNNG